MKKCIRLLLVVMLLVTCKDGVNYIFPSGYRLSKEKTFTSYPTEITIYKIRGVIDIYTLKNYPTFCYDDCMIQKWVYFNNLNDDDQDYVKDDIRKIIRWPDGNQAATKELETVIANISSLYFSGYYIKLKGLGDKTFNRYDFYYLLDIKNKKLYRFKYMKGY